MFFLFGTMGTVRNSVELAIGIPYHQTYTQFRTRIESKTNSEFLKEDTPELRKAYNEEVEQAQIRNKKRIIQDLASSLTAFILGLFFWLFFWKLARKES